MLSSECAGEIRYSDAALSRSSAVIDAFRKCLIPAFSNLLAIPHIAVLARSTGRHYAFLALALARNGGAFGTDAVRCAALPEHSITLSLESRPAVRSKRGR